MKRLLIIFLIGFFAAEALGQQSVDMGVFGGVGTYFGDMANVDFKKSVNSATGGFVRYNFNPRYALRLNMIGGKIGAEGEFDSNVWMFNKSVTDVSILFEFNYLKYIVGDLETPWSSYLFGGVGVQTFDYDLDPVALDSIVDPTYFANAEPSGRVITPTIPFGIGFKVNLSKRLGLGLEGSLRKSMSDKLDNLDDPLSYTPNLPDAVQIKFTDSMHNNDWTSYMCVHLVYKLIYGNKEWELKTRKKRILDWGIMNRNRKQ